MGAVFIGPALLTSAELDAHVVHVAHQYLGFLESGRTLLKLFGHGAAHA